MKQRPKIAIIRIPAEWDPFSRSSYFDEHFLGVLNCLKDHPSWDVAAMGLRVAPIQTLHQVEDLWHGEFAGAIVEGNGKAAIARCADQRIPIVAIDKCTETPKVPTVYSDDAAIGRTAAQYFLRRGYRSLGFINGIYTDMGRPWLNTCRRLEGFSEAARMSGASCDVFGVTEGIAREEPDGTRMQHYFRDLRTWLRKLPRPVAILGAADVWAMDGLEICREEGLRVPQDVAIMGVDNDIFRCEACRPSLSSIDRNRYRIGYESAALLLRYLATRRWGPLPVMVPPAGVVERLSTESLAVADPKVAGALRFVRERFCDPISANDVSRAVGVSESWLREAFRRELHFSLVSEIRRLRLGKACELLAATHLSLKTVAEAAGFHRAAYLCDVFAKDLGVSPSEWRRSQRRGSPSGVCLTAALSETRPNPVEEE